jgi:spore coat protein A, manganese oxidase
MKTKKLSVFLVAVAVFMLAAPFVAQTNQTHLDPSQLTKYLDPLPAPAKLDATGASTVTISEFSQQVLPSNFKVGPYGGKTLVWGYNGSYPGPTIEAHRSTAFKPTFVNNLNNPALLSHLPIDQTLHWADPLHCNMNPACDTQRYTGPVPTVVHLHGAEVPSAFDGNPESWFTPGFGIVGPGWVAQTYTYPNTQEATTLWYHDHALGITRLNVYAGLAGFYLLRDPGHEPANLPAGPYEREIVFQDRLFDTNGQLLYPINTDSYSEHPFWVDMFMGDVAVVNGKAWPYLNVEPRRYRLRLLNGSNDRIYTLQLQTTSGQAGPAFWQIGTDGGLLNKPVQVSQITMAPAERVDLIVDFTGKQGSSFILKNSDGSSHSYGSYNTSLTEIMKINVSLPLSGADNSLNPSTGPNLRPNNPIVALSPTVTSSTVTRHMTLEEDRNGGGFLLNGLHWDDPVTEKPRVGATEVWQIDNHTGLTHPIHVHLIQFQVFSGSSSYGGHTHGSYISPASNSWGGGSGGTDPNAGAWKDTIRVSGWNSVSIVIRWAPQDVAAGTVQPGQNRFAFDPTATMGVTDTFGFPGGPGYVWHCHILEHEDNEMMRPYLVQP